jgi:hypothetical protein
MERPETLVSDVGSGKRTRGDFCASRVNSPAGSLIKHMEVLEPGRDRQMLPAGKRPGQLDHQRLLMFARYVAMNQGFRP